METTEVIIARLVLGYLREEKCRTAYKEFLKTSQYLQTNSVTRIKYLPTRFIGLTLPDILCEYFEISKIVRGRLEATNYYHECHSRTSLVQQLLYLLNKNPSSRTSTPCPRSPLESNLDETSPSHIDHVSDVETTPAHTLPGNIRCTSEDSYLYKTPRRKSSSKLSKSATVADLAEKEDMSEVLAHTLLENKEFHEKIAQTINKVAEKQYKYSSELDRTIKTVVKETEADPIFDKILEEIIGSTAILENCKEVETSSTTSSTAKDCRDELRTKSRRTQTRLTSEHSEDDIKQRTQSTSDTVEQQNAEAVRSIIANSQSNFQTSTPGTQVNSEVTVFNGTLDKYLTTNTCNANTQTQPLEDPLYVDTPGSVLTVPSNAPSNTNSRTTKQYYLLNNQPSTSAKVITEQDILAMPTVIVSDEKQIKISPQPDEPVPALQTKPTLPAIIPKPIVELPPEYFDFYTETSKHLQQIGLKKVIYPKKGKKSKTVKKPTEESNGSVIQVVKKSLPDNFLEEEKGLTDKTTDPPEPNDKTEREQLTPPNAVERVQKTPKSGSHVRNLDFSTPPKITSTHKKSAKNKVNTKLSRKSPPVVHKKPAAKTLFNSKDSEPSDGDKPAETVNKPKTWDADLRAKALPSQEIGIGRISPKRKKKTPMKKVKKLTKKNKMVKNQLDTTEHSAALIEAALQSPLKSVKEKCGDSSHTNDDNTENTKTDDHVDKATNSESNNASTSDNPTKLREGLTGKESIESAVNKTVLSPSKLNANKRKLISSNDTDKNTNDDSVKTEDGKKFITPEMVKENVHYPIKANRNVVSLFDTPFKNEIPKTPGAVSPNTSLHTPFSKMLEANLKGIDISSLPTPNIPITPNFPPYTPNVDVLSPYSNRPTDYSTSSSYYQPSDSEPNRSLEANVIELEKQSVSVLANVVVKKGVQVGETNLESEHKSDTIKTVCTSVDERLKLFNGSIIGKKNLSLVKRNIPSNSSSSSDSSSESSNEDENLSSNSIEASNETVIFNKKVPETPKRTYSLRNRTVTSANKKEDIQKISEGRRQASKDSKANVKLFSNSIQKSVTEKSQTSHKDDKEMEHEETEKLNKEESLGTLTLQQIELKKELNKKLIRTQNKIKTAEKPTLKKTTKRTTKNVNPKFMKIKLVTGTTKNKRKTKSDQKQNKSLQNDDTLSDTNISQIQSESVDKRKKVASPHYIKDSEKIDKSASDIEAQNLIEGLKEREDANVENISSSNILANDSNEENRHETSTSELETEWRETYDMKAYEGEHECVVFSDSKKASRAFESYNIEVLQKTFIGKVFVEDINEEVDIPLVVSPFYTLLDIPSTKRNLSQKQNLGNQKTKTKGDKKTDTKSVGKDSVTKTEANKTSVCLQQNPLSADMNRTFPECSKEDSEAPSIKKRKLGKEDCQVPEEKDCKILLQQINVDTFLNNIYGNR